MTRQHGPIGRIGEIELFPGYQVNKPAINKYPQDRLFKFLVVNPNKKVEVKNFCIDYKFIPRGYPLVDLKKAFKKDQSEIKEIYEKLCNSRLSQEDINRVNNYYSHIKHDLEKVSKNTLKSLNQESQNNGLDENFKEYEFIEIRKDEGTYVSLWNDLRNLIRTKGPRKCLECGSFFVITRKDKKFCTDTCRNTFNHRK